MPTVKVWPRERTGDEGQDAYFYCFAGGQQSPRIKWSRRDGKPLSIRVSTNGKSLVIRRTRKEDEGMYICTARNSYGYETARGKLNIRGNVPYTKSLK